MRIESVSHLSDSTLEQELENLAATDRGTTVRLLVHIAEFNVRKLYLADGFASMYAYSVGELKMSEDVACRRIRAASVHKTKREVQLLLAARFPRVVAIDVAGYDNRVLVGGPPRLAARALRAAVARSPVLSPTLPTLSFRTLR